MAFRCIVFLLVFTIAGCATSPPSNKNNLCEIYREKAGWYKDSLRAAKRWGGPIHVPMAIMYQESGFKAKAKPPMRYFLGFIPYGRASNAYGYSQALDSTWAQYKKEGGGVFSQRDDFEDAMDFIQWYMNKTHKINGVSKWDAYAQYLNYHEGQGGYASGTYKRKKWLIGVARKVERLAGRYQSQYQSCKKELDKKLNRWSLF